MPSNDNSEKITLRQTVIIGGGPAGAMVAWKLARAGRDVLLVDAKTFPRFKPCAGWVTLDALCALEVDPATYPHLLVPITRVAIGLTEGLQITQWPEPVSYGILRHEFDAFLLERARTAGAEILEDHRVERVIFDHDCVHCLIKGQRISSVHVVGAGGSNCPVARAVAGRSPWQHRTTVAAQMSEVPIGAAKLQQSRLGTGMPVLYPEPECDGYAWYFAKGDFLNIGVGALTRSGPAIPQRRQRFLQRLQRESILPDSWSLSPFVGHSYAIWRGTRPDLGGPRHLLVGDAAGLAHDWSGEGIGPAGISGTLAAAAILKNPKGHDFTGYAKELVSLQGNGFSTRIGGLLQALPLFIRQTALNHLCGNPWLRRRWVLEGAFLGRW
ncbi:MAG: NAD(P)/FAD-dependent oxidoreductase [Magnetococcales bacterium]|nr:NAD(P)/FAD-dependent oxidoreductase [Magnetococcales bacterium]